MSEENNKKEKVEGPIYRGGSSCMFCQKCKPEEPIESICIECKELATFHLEISGYYQNKTNK